MRTTFNLSFGTRLSKANKQGLSPIELTITINGERRTINLPVKANAKSNWQKANKDYLKAVELKIDKLVREFADNELTLTADELTEAYKRGYVKRCYTIEDLFADYLEIMKDKSTRDSYNKYQRVRDRFFELVDRTKPANSITNYDIMRYKAKIDKLYQEGPATGYMTKLKSYIRFGLDNGKLNSNPFAGIKIKKVNKPVETITEQELNSILNKQIDNPRLNKIRELFCFACGTGLSFADITNLKPEDIKEIDGKLVIIKDRQKTGVKFYSVLMPWAVEIANKYHNDLTQLFISNQKTNNYLKELADICKVSSVPSLHFHLARHYYLTYAINHNIPLEIVQHLAGHSNIKQTEHYAKMMTSTILSSVTRAFNLS